MDASGAAAAASAAQYRAGSSGGRAPGFVPDWPWVAAELEARRLALPPPWAPGQAALYDGGLIEGWVFLAPGDWLVRREGDRIEAVSAEALRAVAGQAEANARAELQEGRAAEEALGLWAAGRRAIRARGASDEGEEP